MLSVGDIVQPGAIGASYGMAPYTVVPGHSGPAAAGIPSLADGPGLGQAANLTSQTPALAGQAAGYGGQVPSAGQAPVLAGQAPGLSSLDGTTPGVGGSPLASSSVTAPYGGSLPAGTPPALLPSTGTGTLDSPDLEQVASQAAGYPATPSSAGIGGVPDAFSEPPSAASLLPTAPQPVTPVPESALGRDAESYKAVMSILRGTSA